MDPNISDDFCKQVELLNQVREQAGKSLDLPTTSNNQPDYASYGELTQVGMIRFRTCSRARSASSTISVHKGLTTYMRPCFVRHVPLSGYLNIASIGNSEYVQQVHCFCPAR